MAKYPPIQYVDENNNPIGEGPMAEAHRTGTYFRTVHVFVEDTTGKLLLQRRGQQVATYPDYWDYAVAGYVDSGETYLETAIRELSEELGISGFEPQQLDVYRKNEVYESRQLNRFVGVFKIVVPANIAIEADPSEVSEVRWFSLDDFRQLIANLANKVTPALKADFKKYYENNQHQATS